MDNRILVTGATSFLGTRFKSICNLPNYEVIFTSKNGDASSNILAADITNLNSITRIVQQVRPQIVLHMGGLVDLSRNIEIGKLCMEVNAIGTMNVLEAVKGLSLRQFIYTSSEEVYGNVPIPYNEEQRVSPPSPYAISKVAAEHWCSWYAHEYTIPTVILRLGTLYGAEQPFNKYFAQIIEKAIRHDNIPTNSGLKQRDYLYIDDAVALLQLVIQKSSLASDICTILNATGGKPYALIEVISEIIRLTNSQSSIRKGIIPERVTERGVWHACNDKVYKLYGWKPNVDLYEGLAKMVTYFITHYGKTIDK